MIFDTATIICLIATHVMVGLAPLVIRDQLWYAKKMGTFKRLHDQQEKLSAKRANNYSEPGITAIEIEPEFMTEEEHMKYLSKKYSAQLKQYHEHKKPIHERMDRYVMRLLIANAEGKIAVDKISQYTIKFTNGDELWIANKYYAYGNLHRSEKQPAMAVGNDFHVNPYTFLMVLDLEEKLADPTYRFTKKQIKVIS